MCGSDDNGGELAEIEREQDGLAEEGSSLRECLRITRSMTVAARQKETPPRSDNNADGPPRESNATPTLTEQIDEDSDNEVQWDYPEERDDDKVVRNDETNSNEDRNECSVEEITDWTDDVDNGLSWNYSEERDDNEDDDDLNGNRATPPTNAVVPHRTALPPLANSFSATLPPKIPMDYAADPAILTENL